MSIPGYNGGTSTAYFNVLGPTAPRNYTFPDANSTIPDIFGTGAVGTWPISITGTATDIAGVLGETHGGTGNSSYIFGDILYASATNTLSKLAGNVTAAPLVLTSIGNGTNNISLSWQPLPVSGILIYYLTNTSAGIASDYKQIVTPVASPVTIVSSSLVNGQLIATWITDAGFPGVTSIPAGQYANHLHLAKTGGTSDLQVRTEIWETNSSGTDIAKIADLGPSTILGGANAEYIIADSVAEYTLTNSSSRIATKLYAVITGGGSAPDITIYMGGTSDSRTDLPAANVDATNFVPYTGATTNLDMGSYNITATGLNLTGLTASQAVVTDGSKNLASLAYTSSGTVSTLVYRDSSGNFSASTITAALNGNAATATSATTATTATNANNAATVSLSTNAEYYPLFVASTTNSNQPFNLNSGLHYNPSTENLTATTFTGSFSGTVTNALNVATTQVSTNASFYPLFVASSTNSDQPCDLGTGLTFNPSTNTLTTTTFSGALSGNATTATTLQTARAIYGNNFDGSAALTQIIASTYGGTGNGFTKFSGATTTEKTYSLPDATCTILTTNAAVTATQGGTGQSTYATGDTLYASATNTLSKLAGNTTTAKQYLSQTGTGTASQAPAWATISGSDITGAALTKTDDTNVTLSLTGSPSTALLNATNMALGWTGTLSGTRGGTGVNNGSSTITIGGSVTYSGAFTFTGTLTGTTSVTFPTSGTLATTAGTVANATNIAITNDTTTNASMFPVWVTANTGNLPAKVSSTKLSFNPSTGLLNLSALTASYAVVTDSSKNLTSLQYTTTATASALVQRDASNYIYSTGLTMVKNGGVTVTDFLVMADSSQALNNKYWGSSPSGTSLYFYTISDALNSSTNWLQVTRSGNTISSVNFNSTATFNITGTTNIASLTASQAVVTDGSKNLASLAYTSANTVSTIVSRDSSGNFSAGTITAALSGNATTATTATNATNTAITDDTTTAATMYPTWVTTTTGNLPQKISSTKLTFNPSTGTLTATNFSGSINTATEASDTTCFPVFVTASGTQSLPLKTNTGFTFNAVNSALGCGPLTASSITVGSLITAAIYARCEWDMSTASPTIRSSMNVSSISDNGVGKNGINMTNAMADANYTVLCFVRNEIAGGDMACNLEQGQVPTSSSFRMASGRAGTGFVDSVYANAIVVY